jgi:hypothetical protein
MHLVLLVYWRHKCIRPEQCPGLMRGTKLIGNQSNGSTMQEHLLQTALAVLLMIPDRTAVATTIMQWTNSTLLLILFRS